MTARPWNTSALLTHTAGGSMTAALLAAFLWQIFCTPGPADQDPHELGAALTEARNAAAALHHALDQQERQVARTQRDLAAIGQMPPPIPAESLLGTLSHLALENRISVLRQHPLPPRSYPGLLEQRLAYEVTGALADLLRFFQAVETSPSWADIGYLKVDDARIPQDSKARRATLTFSAFSMAPASAPATPKTTTGG